VSIANVIKILYRTRDAVSVQIVALEKKSHGLRMTSAQLSFTAYH